MNDCTCTGPGFCERHGIYKNAHWVHLCQTNVKYRNAWQAGIGPGQLIPTGQPNGPKICGCGCHLSRILSRLWINSSAGCDCAKHAATMDKWGAERCRRELDTILQWLAEESQKRHLPFVRVIAKRLVLRAIRNAERELSEVQDGHVG